MIFSSNQKANLFIYLLQIHLIILIITTIIIINSIKTDLILLNFLINFSIIQNQFHFK